MRVLEINAPFSPGGIIGKMDESKLPSRGDRTSALNHDARARMEQLSKAQEKWKASRREKDENSSNDSLSSGDK